MITPIDNEGFRKLLRVVPAKTVQTLFNLYRQSLVNLSYSMAHDRTLAEDIVQEAFVHLWENRMKLSRPHARSIEHYLVKVVMYKSITHFRKHSRKSGWLTQYMMIRLREEPEATPEALMIRQEIRRELRQLISTFPERERTCLLMRMDGEMSLRQIAEQLNVTTKAVQRSLTSGSRRLRKKWFHGYRL